MPSAASALRTSQGAARAHAGIRPGLRLVRHRHARQQSAVRARTRTRTRRTASATTGKIRGPWQRNLCAGGQHPRDALLHPHRGRRHIGGRGTAMHSVTTWNRHAVLACGTIFRIRSISWLSQLALPAAEDDAHASNNITLQCSGAAARIPPVRRRAVFEYIIHEETLSSGWGGGEFFPGDRWKHLEDETPKDGIRSLSHGPCISAHAPRKTRGGRREENARLA